MSSFKKGDVLVVRHPFDGLRPITERGMESWRELYAGDMIDSGGEPRLPPKTEWYDVLPGMRLIVTRARVHRGNVEMVNPEDGTQFLSRRSEVEMKAEVLR